MSVAPNRGSVRRGPRVRTRTEKITWGKNGRAINHGTDNGYRNGCGCDPCWEAHEAKPYYGEQLKRDREVSRAASEKPRS